MRKIDAIIIGAGAAGLMCAIEAGKRSRQVVVLEQANKPGKKILMSGGGRCNFTNYHIQPYAYISHNPHFIKSALSRYTQWDFIELVKKHNIPFHEKTLGQLFCDHKSKAILEMLLNECAAAKVEIILEASVKKIEKNTQENHAHFTISTAQETFSAESLIIASGGLSIPTMGASPFAYTIAEQFGIKVWPTRAGLVPFTLHEKDKNKFAPLSGVSVHSRVSNARANFLENILFTHRGLSGPAILQISSYWMPGETVQINLLPHIELFEYLKNQQIHTPNKSLKNILFEHLPKRLIEILFTATSIDRKVAEISHRALLEIAEQINQFVILPNGTEGYRTAEVTLGGIDCDALSSRTMAVKTIPGLYFIGEAVDITGWLGGYNFQWAWSSGWAAGQVI